MACEQSKVGQNTWEHKRVSAQSAKWLMAGVGLSFLKTRRLGVKKSEEGK